MIYSLSAQGGSDRVIIYGVARASVILGFSPKLSMTKSMCFCCFYGFICDFLLFPSVKSSKLCTAHRTQRDTKFEHEKVGFVKAVFSGLIDFP